MYHPSELIVIDIAKRYLALSVQANHAYQTAQRGLALDLALSQERLQSSEGTAMSLDALARLVALTQAHKAAFQAVVLGSSRDIAAATAELPVELRAQYTAKFLASTQWQLEAQSRFYATREHWITTAVEICSLIESRRATCTFGERGVRFQDEADVDLFEMLMARLRDWQCVEVEAHAVRMERLRHSLAVLGLHTG